MSFNKFLMTHSKGLPTETVHNINDENNRYEMNIKKELWFDIVKNIIDSTNIIVFPSKISHKDIQITKIRNADFDYLYDENEFEAINEALIEMNWASLAQLFYDWKSSSPHANENDGIAKKEKYDIEISLKQILKTEAGECFLKTCPSLGYYNSNNNTSNNYLKRKHEETMNTTSEDNLLFTNVEIESDEFVRGNSNIQLNDLLPHWRLGMKIRQSYINSNVDLNLILDKYKAYSRSDGYQLINDDFKSLFSDVNFEHKFLEVLPKLTVFLQQNVLNKSVAANLKSISNKGLTDQIIAVLMGLHAYLYESGKKADGKSKISIANSIKFMILLSNNIQSHDTEILTWREELLRQNYTFQPTIIAFGTDYDSIVQNNFILYCDGMKFQFVNLLRAIEILLNIHMLFNLKWPIPNQNVYIFLFNMIYGKFCKSKQSANVKTLLNYMKAKE
ncbi:hypothetical protein PVAND_013316 [Polypedilum vanderplanki]|uniref:Uncharacterized protein n=1 Tax=Polypedilum vanderplanki TaxID=319348 RepID=A0A9J6CR63_POLVA|nr:hypothetical protein PVAND_013316 [Polypedilum vanderplanki]